MKLLRAHVCMCVCVSACVCACVHAAASHIFRGCNLPLALQAKHAKIFTFFSPSDIGLMVLSSSSYIFYNYLHISNASLRAHYSVMSAVLLLARVQPSGVLVWKKPI